MADYSDDLTGWNDTLSIINDLKELYQNANDVQTLKDCAHLQQQLQLTFHHADNDAKQIIRDLTKQVASKKADAREYEQLQKTNSEHDQVTANFVEASEDVVSKEQQIQANYQELLQLEEKIMDTQKRHTEAIAQANVEVPKIKYSLALYATITQLKWDFSDKQKLAGSVINPASGQISTFSLDPSKYSDFDLANQVWNEIEATE